MRDPFFSVPKALASGLLVLGLSLLAYWPGLSGPWLFDDYSNLEPVQGWLNGDLTWQEVILQNNAGPGGRPVSMASFIINAGVGGYSPHSFKLGNLILHMVNGFLVFSLCLGMARRDRIFAKFPLTAAIVVAALWLLHPMLVSTTLYAVQRMAMLSATFMMLAMLAYLHGRDLLIRDRPTGWAWLLLVVPLLGACAYLSKENGLVTLLLCGVIELGYYTPDRGTRRHRAGRVFLLFGVALPIILGVLVLAIWPDWLLGGYHNRPFTLLERTLTQPRVLFDYASSLLLPWGPRLSLFRDDYVLSTGLFSPFSTLLAVIGWGMLIAAAIALRSRIPAFSVGLGIYLVGHSLESSIFPLLVYFEHRNYLPAIGLIWAAFGLAAAGGLRLAPQMHQPRLVFGAAVALLIFVFAIATNARASVWRSLDRLLFSSLQHHSTSAWLHLNIAQLAMDAVPQRPDVAREHLRTLMESGRPAVRQMGLMNLTAIDCLVDRRVEPERADQLFTYPGRPIEPDLMNAIENAASAVQQGSCKGLTPALMARNLGRWLDDSDLAEGWPMKSRLRYQAAVLHAVAGDPKSSLEQADIAWNSGRDELAVGGLRVASLIALGRHSEARKLLKTLNARPEAGGSRAKEFLDSYKAQLGEIEEQENPAPP